MEARIRTLQIWLDGSYMEVEVEQPAGWSEDQFTEAAIDYVLSNISIDVL